MAGLNLFDRAIGVFAPAAAARRGLARMALADIGKAFERRGYDAAKSKGRMEGWRGSGGSAAADTGPALDVIRRRARDIAVNDGWGAQICGKLPAKMIGTGIVPRAKTKDKGVRERARDAWDSFVENSDPTGQSDFYGQSFLVAATVIKSGEALVRWYVRDKVDGLRVPLQCEVLEPDYIDTRRLEVLPNGNLIVQGVEFDPKGCRVAYWLFPVHPGEIGLVGLRMQARYQSQRVDARFVDHVYRVDRPGQVRGVSWLAPILMTARDISDYEEAELVRKKIAACLSFFVKTESGSAGGIAKVVREQSANGSVSRIESAKPGRIHYLDPGEEIQSVDPAPSPSTGYADFLATQLRKCAAGVGMTYEALSGDLSGVNFSSIREGKLDFWEMLDAWQYHMLIPQHCRPAWRRVMHVASHIAGLKVPADQMAIFTPPKRPWVDPLKDVQAKLMEIRSGLTSWTDAVSERGDDPEDQLAEILEWLPRLKDAGVSFDAGKQPQQQPQKQADATGNSEGDGNEPAAADDTAAAA